MPRHVLAILFAIILTRILLPNVAAAADTSELLPITVSPGGLAGEWVETSACPTFSWGLLLTDEVELVVYDARQTIESGAGSPAISTRFPGTVSSWTASGSSCFEPGERYAWSVRGIETARKSPQETRWSEPRFFAVRHIPSAEEIEEALEVLARAQGGLRSGVLPSGSVARGATAAETSAPGFAAAQRQHAEAASSSRAFTTPTGTGLSAQGNDAGWAALHGKNPSGRAGYFEGEVEVDGRIEVQETFSGFGGSGISAHVGGTGLVAAVKGSNEGGSSEGYLGFLTTGVYGLANHHSGIGVVGEAANGGTAGLFYGPVGVQGLVQVTGQLELLDQLDCTDCIDSQDLGDGSVGEAEIQPRSVGALQLKAAAVEPDHLSDGAVTAAKIPAETIEKSHFSSDLIVYGDRGDLYMREGEVTAAPGDLVQVSAQCDSKEHLPIQGDCRYLFQRLHRSYSFNWTDDTQAAGWSCSSENTSTVDRTLTARIFCVR